MSKLLVVSNPLFIPSLEFIRGIKPSIVNNFTSRYDAIKATLRTLDFFEGSQNSIEMNRICATFDYETLPAVHATLELSDLLTNMNQKNLGVNDIIYFYNTGAEETVFIRGREHYFIPYHPNI